MTRRCTMTGAHYELIASIVRTMPEEHRTAVSRHFAIEFTKRSPAFDAGAWSERTRPLVDNSEAARTARVKAYLEEAQ